MSENELEREYKVFPTSGLVMGFQYKGQLLSIMNHSECKLSTAGITGITDSYKIFKNSADIGTILVFFTEIGFAHFTSHPTNEFFNLSLSLDDIFDKYSIVEVEERLAIASTDQHRIKIIEQFLVTQLKDIQTDKLIIEAIKLIHQSKGTIRIKELSERLFVSQSLFEKRFRKVAGTTAKKFASIVRFNAVLENLNETKTLTEICYESKFFDQAHFIKVFKQYTGHTPENFKHII
ncbi:AraC family transcriptional regulator [Reichenbachiella agarivorans]|uniref:AraC family transcriptional regulator n=1 Tax=Reichenbachiella agarivorans TaxID=2979464 RepID=A0ABY6CQD2_9BACT|nr:AraC family transcriptional regulator [Reichenbachiella agarivorans]